MRKLLGIVSMIAIVATAAPGGAQPAPRALVEKQRTFYVVGAHPDDELSGWAYLEQLPKDLYLVFVTFTRGEATDSCLSPEEADNNAGSDALAPTDLGTFGMNLLALPTATGEDSSGPYKYEGPRSPVGETDKGERHPLGNPWVGQRTEACADARIASWHWFLDAQFKNDGIGTDLAVVEDPEVDDDYKGVFCPPGHKGRGDGRPISKKIGCAQVWADEVGARVVYDLGDQGFVYDHENQGTFLPTRFTSEHVTAALQATRRNRTKWSIAPLPEAGVVSTSFYGDGDRCSAEGGTDHDVVNQAVRYHDQGLPLRAGVMGCATDKLGEGAEVRELHQSPTSLIAWNLINPATGDRMGAALVNYGWLFPNYSLLGCAQTETLGCFFWEIRS